MHRTMHALEDKLADKERKEEEMKEVLLQRDSEVAGMLQTIHKQLEKKESKEVDSLAMNSKCLLNSGELSVNQRFVLHTWRSRYIWQNEREASKRMRPSSSYGSPCERWLLNTGMACVDRPDVAV